MHKILKKTIKYGAAVLLTLIAVILTGIGYLYLGTFIKYYKISQLIHTQSIAN